MLGEQRIKQITDKVLSLSQADQTEVVFFGDTSALTRFANNYIHQNVAETNMQVNIRMVIGKKIGVASTNDLSDAGLQKAVEHAATITRFQLENPDFKSLPTPEEAGKAVGVRTDDRRGRVVPERDRDQFARPVRHPARRLHGRGAEP